MINIGIDTRSEPYEKMILFRQLLKALLFVLPFSVNCRCLEQDLLCAFVSL